MGRLLDSIIVTENVQTVLILKVFVGVKRKTKSLRRFQIQDVDLGCFLTYRVSQAQIIQKYWDWMMLLISVNTKVLL